LNLLIFDRRLKCRLAIESNGWKGITKFDRVSPVGCHKQSDLKCTGCVHRTQVGLPQCLRWDNEVSDGNLYIRDRPQIVW